MKKIVGAQGIVEDPVNYMAVWLIDPANPNEAAIETIIWNTQKPMPRLDATAQ